jgi:hypothetical protein
MRRMLLGYIIALKFHSGADGQCLGGESVRRIGSVSKIGGSKFFRDLRACQHVEMH